MLSRIARCRRGWRPALSRIASQTVLAVLIAISPGARAQEFAGSHISAWLQSLDLTEGWTSTFESLRYDPETRTAIVTGLKVDGDGISIEINTLQVDNYQAAGDGGFTARALAIPDLNVRTASFDISLNGLRLAEVYVPKAAISYNSRKPFTSFTSFLFTLATSGTSGGSIEELVLTEQIDGITSRISYQNIAIGRLADGKLEWLRASPFRMQSPSSNPLVDLTISSLQTSGIDLNALLDVYDSRRYGAGAGDMRWRRAVAEARYRDITVALPGIELSADSTVLDGLRVRPPPENFAPLADAMLTEREVAPAMTDALTERYLADMLSAFGLDRLTIEKAEFTAVGIDWLGFDRFTISDMSSDRIGEIILEGFEGAVAGQGRIATGRLTLGDMIPPSPDAVVQAVEQFQRNGNPDLTALTPRLGSIEITGLDLQAIDFPGATLGSLRADFGGYVSSIPTEIDFILSDLDVATASLQPASARRMIAGLGYDRIEADAAFKLRWDEEQTTLSLPEARLDIENFGTFAGNFALSGVTREIMERPEKNTSLPASILFERGSLTFEDKSAVERALAMRAELLNVPVDRLRQQLSGALPLMLAFLIDAERLKKLVPVLQGFITTPGTLTVEARPEPPVPVSALMDAARERPQSLPTLLNIEISGTSGKAAPSDMTQPRQESSD